jgi:transcriptional regulator with XRE-family HTH domain
MYSKPLQQVGRCQNIHSGKSCQEENFDLGKSEESEEEASEFIKEFARRVRKAYGGRQQKEIAEDLKVSDAHLSKVLGGKIKHFEPHVQLVISISENTRCSTDWLLKEKGEEPVNILKFLDPTVRDTVEVIADIEGREPEELIADLVGNALEALAAHMIKMRRELRPTEIRKLKALLKLVAGEVIAEVPPATKKRKSG